MISYWIFYFKNTVFVGALHGMLNAEGLAHIFNDLFGGVVYAGIGRLKGKIKFFLFFFYVRYQLLSYFEELGLNVF